MTQMQKSYGFDNGQVVGVCDADIYFDEKEGVDTGDPAELAREVIKLIVGAQNPGLQAEILALLLGVGFRGCSEQEIATKNRCTRAAVSARLVKVRERLSLSRPVGPMRGDSTREECERSRYFATMR